MQLQLHSNPAITVADLKEAGYHEMHVLDDVFLARELEFLGCSRQTFEKKAAQAQAYKDAAYPMPLDGDVYPYISDQVGVCLCTPTAAADAILADKLKYDDIVRHTERARLSAVNNISINGLLSTVARAIFNWRHSFGLSSTMGATFNKTIVTPAPDAPYQTVDVAGDGIDELVITLPEKSLGADMEIVVEAFAPPGDPWRGQYTATYANPASPFTLTFNDPVAPTYPTSNIKWLVTIRNMPRVPQYLVVNSTTA